MVLLLRSKIATRNRSPPGALSKKASPGGEAFVFAASMNIAAAFDDHDHRRQLSTIPYDGRHVAIQSALAGACSCLFMSKHVAARAGTGQPC